MTLFDIVLVAVVAAAIPTFGVLLRVDAPYGKHARGGWGPGVNPRLGWLLMELPALLSFLWFFVTGAHAQHLLPVVFCALFAGHYVHRALVYPFQIQPAPGSEVKMVIVLLGAIFNLANGYLNGAWLSRYAINLYNLVWIKDPRFAFGITLFFAGFVMNRQSDAILQSLRDAPGSDYAIPYGGSFRYVSSPHYLGELMQWSGFALASWSPAAAAFVLFSAANLIPRALATHRWYRQKFPDYPPDRKAVLPYIL